MGLDSPYAEALVLLSLAIAAIWIADVWKAVRAYRFWHDERSARNLLLAVVFCICAIGLAISATGIIVGDGPGVAFAVSGLGLARGALLVGGIVLLVTGYGRR